MNKVLLIVCAVIGLVMVLISFPEGGIAVLTILIIAIPAIFLIRGNSDEKEFLTTIFLVAVLLRILLGLIIYIFDLRWVFGPDSYYYEHVGGRLAEIWSGVQVPDDLYTHRAKNIDNSGWGMIYLVAVLTTVFGRNFLLLQSFCGVIGALTAPMVYFCADNIFNNKRVSTISALSIAIFPSFVIWSSQLLKDGLIIFLLVCVMTAVLYLQKRFSYLTVFSLILSLFGIISLRFYIFYMVVVSVAGSFLIGLNSSAQSIVRNVLIVIILGLALTYLGVIRNASSSFEQFGSLEQVQNSRLDLATSADSGFGEDLDVSTPEGAIAAIPIGLVYLFFAPFPWQAEKLNQILVLPETFLWWALIPTMISGFWYTLKNKLRAAIPIIIFSIMLTLSYSIFQGNVGMLYRQRTQIQVFLFIFIAVGWTLIQERKENTKLMRQIKERELKSKS